MLRNDWKDRMEPDDMVCANCEHWKEAARVAIPMDDGFMERRLCRHAGFYGDAGAGAVTLVGPESDWHREPEPARSGLPMRTLRTSKQPRRAMTTA